MVRKTSQNVEKLLPPSLTEPRESVAAKLQVQIDKGHEILAQNMKSRQDLEEAERAVLKWEKFCTELLLRLFSNSVMADEYNYRPSVGFFSLEPNTLQEDIDEYKKKLNRKLDRLLSIHERLELIPGPIDQANQPARYPSASTTDGRKIFIVHGHDEATKLAVTHFIEKLKLIPVVLHEQANAGKTIIEKFEANSDVRFAIVLLTPDDVCLQPDGSKTARARQNVIFELGFFVGRIGRENVCALCKTGVERNSDIDGVLYVPLDDAGAWKLGLATELKHAGIDFDPSNLI